MSNLQRQIQFGEADLGRAKVEAARERIAALNADVAVEAVAQHIDAESVRSLVRGWDVVIDGTDSFETRALIGDACVAEGAVLIAAAVGRWDVQVAVLRGKPCWRCFVPEIPPGAETCVAAGVVGALTGVAGSLAALAAIKAITGADEDATGELMILDALNWRVRTVTIAADPACTTCA